MKKSELKQLIIEEIGNQSKPGVKIHTIIPYYSDGVEINLNEVKSFYKFEDASKYINTLRSNYDHVENEII